MGSSHEMNYLPTSKVRLLRSIDRHQEMKKGLRRSEASDTHVCNLKKPVQFRFLYFCEDIPYLTATCLFCDAHDLSCLKRFSDNPSRRAGEEYDQAGPLSVRWRSLVLVAGD